MPVSRTATTAARVSPSGCVVGGWLLTMAAVGGFAFAAGDTVQNTADTPAPTPAVAATEAPTTSPNPGSAIAVYLPTRAGAFFDGRVTAVPTPTPVVPGPADITCSLIQGGGHAISQVRSPDRAARSSNSRGPASVARVSATACRLADTQSASTKPAIKAASAASGR